jgi:hypothetical protein
MGEEEQATPWRFFKVADSIAVRDENFLEVKNRWILHQLLRFLLVRGGAPLETVLSYFLCLLPIFLHYSTCSLWYHLAADHATDERSLYMTCPHIFT